jgi:D-serine deaminase-like pyridoxal phosphate-dependent protein
MMISTLGSAAGHRKVELDTPVLLLDLDVMEQNIARIAKTCDRHGIGWRPHIKGQKVPAIAHKMLAAGAIGVTCAKLDEAEVMIASGIRNVMIANQVVGPRKAARLAGLARHADIVVAVDDPENVDGLERACQTAGSRLGLVIEIDCGLSRAGVHAGEPCLGLAKHIARQTHVGFSGVMTWEGHAAGIEDQVEKALAVELALGQLTASADLCRQHGLTTPIVSCGGTGTYWLSAAYPGITEIQAGGGVFCDVRYRTRFGVDHPYALTVLSTVTSRPTSTRVVCDAGKKSMSADSALPVPIGLESVREVRLSAEHTTIELFEPDHRLRIGDRLEFVVGYADTSVNLHDEIVGMRGDRVEIVWPIPARGRSR